jgi:hypothetical protein
MTFRQILDEFHAKRAAFPRGIGISELANLVRVECERIARYERDLGISRTNIAACWKRGRSVEAVLDQMRAERGAVL